MNLERSALLRHVALVHAGRVGGAGERLLRWNRHGALDEAPDPGALEALASALPAGPRTELWVVGGAALVLLYEAREATRDVDAFTLEAAFEDLWEADRGPA